MSLSLLAFFAVLFVLVYLLRVAKIGALVAFLLAGVLSGPYVFNLFEFENICVSFDVIETDHSTYSNDEHDENE